MIQWLPTGKRAKRQVNGHDTSTHPSKTARDQDMSAPKDRHEVCWCLALAHTVLAHSHRAHAKPKNPIPPSEARQSSNCTRHHLTTNTHDHTGLHLHSPFRKDTERFWPTHLISTFPSVPNIIRLVFTSICFRLFFYA